MHGYIDFLLSPKFRIAKGYAKQFYESSQAKLEITADKIESYFLDKCETLLTHYVNTRYIVGATIKNATSIVAWFNNQPFHGAPLSVTLVHNAIVQAKLGPAFGISVTNSPLPYKTRSQIEMLRSGGSFGFKLAISVTFSMAFVAAFYLVPYVKVSVVRTPNFDVFLPWQIIAIVCTQERECRSKLLQFVSGVNVLTFWITSFIWDYTIYLVITSGLIATLGAFQEDGWSTVPELAKVSLILISFGFAVIPTTYVATMFFSASATAFTRMTMYFVLTGNTYSFRPRVHSRIMIIILRFLYI